MVAKPVPLSEIQNGLVGLMAMPHGLIRLGSTSLAGTAPSETRFVTLKSVSADAGAMPTAQSAAAPASENIMAAPQELAIVLAIMAFPSSLVLNPTSNSAVNTPRGLSIRWTRQQ